MTKITTINNKTYLQTNEAKVASVFLEKKVYEKHRSKDDLYASYLEFVGNDRCSAASGEYDLDIIYYPIYIPIETVIEAIKYHKPKSYPPIWVSKQGYYIDDASAVTLATHGDLFTALFPNAKPYHPNLTTITNGDRELIKEILSYAT